MFCINALVFCFLPEKLLTAMYKFKGAYETTKSKEVSLRKPLETVRSAAIEKKSELQKSQNTLKAAEISLKKARRNSGHGKTKRGAKPSAADNAGEDDLGKYRIENIISAILLAGEKRRSQVNRCVQFTMLCP